MSVATERWHRPAPPPAVSLRGPRDRGLVVALLTSLVAHGLLLGWLQSLPASVDPRPARVLDVMARVAPSPPAPAASPAPAAVAVVAVPPQERQAPEPERSPAVAPATQPAVETPPPSEPEPRARQPLPPSERPPVVADAPSPPVPALLADEAPSVDRPPSPPSPAAERPVVAHAAHADVESPADPTASRGEGSTAEPHSSSVPSSASGEGVESAVASAAPASAEPAADGAGSPVPGTSAAELRASVDTHVPYPREAWSNRWEAECTALFEVDERGRVTRVTELHCSDHAAIFGPAFARHAERRFRFQPARSGGERVSSQVRWTHRFALDGL